MSSIHEKFDHNAKEFRANPEPYYSALLKAGIGRSDCYGGMWVVSRYDDVRKVSYDVQNFTPAKGTLFPPVGNRPLLPMEMDSPAHMEYRKLLLGRFSRKAMIAWDPAIRQTAQELLQAALAETPSDLSLFYAKLLPTSVICQILGIRFEPVFQKWVENSVYRRISDPELAQDSSDKIYRHFEELLPERRQHPGDDLISLLATSKIDGEYLSDETVVNMCGFLLIAGLDNTNFTIRGLLHQMAVDPVLQQRLADSPEDIDKAVEEALRYFSPVITLGRHSVRDTEVNGCPIAGGEKVAMMFGCANRDPKEFRDPNEFDIDRFPNRHVAFGIGPHRCLGSNLARLEVAIAAEEVLKAMPRFRLADNVQTTWDDLGPLPVVAA